MRTFVILLLVAAAVAEQQSLLEVPNSAACIKATGVCGLVSQCTGVGAYIMRGVCTGDNTISCCVRSHVDPAPPTPNTPNVPATPVTPVTPVPASSGLPRCSNGAATSGTYNGVSSTLNQQSKASTWSLIPSVTYNAESGNPYRVVRDVYGNLPITDPRLENVASSGAQQKLHKVCAARFNALARAGAAAGFTFKVASGYRIHPYKNDYNYYCQQMKIAYPAKSCKEAGAVKAFKSPHETGLAFDLGSPSPFSPQMVLDGQIRASKGFKWLVANAHLYGVTPYKHESWHWECVIPREAWATACEFTSNYNTRVRETRNSDHALTSALGAWA